ncbi:adenylate kinase [Methanocalculus chunghsingensis]|uniref:Putative adenylate kinase n=1 Tax=Methanocalculus chunghsingensis TaxID=156457 RepID=A0A8J7W586_9EURY|nr:adenylate kinase family protein [Methanocalculus chunghsingensis]MBR1368539.1 adenylate kinase [Methanocalculus chunghsingensis]
MMLGLTGVPGTGKTTVADILRGRGVPVIRVNDTIEPYIIGSDPDRDTRIIDEDRWVEEFPPVEGVVEGHLAHLLPCDRIVILRCNPEVLFERLIRRGYTEEKALENALAEALDTVLIEVFEAFESEVIYEFETTDTDSGTVADFVMDVLADRATPSHGRCDWSDYLLNRMP